MSNLDNEDIMLTKFSIINESETTKRKGVLSTVEGEFMEFEKKNRNERYYDISVGETILKSPYVKEMMKNKTLLGEAQHPKDRFETVTTEASHCVTDLWFSEDKKHLLGRADILDTPAGRVVQTLIDYGSILGVSARASGKLIEGKRNGEKVFLVDEDSYTFKTFDIVLNPGFASARLDTVNESVENLKNENIITKYINESVNDIQDIYELKKVFSDNETICETIKNKEVQLKMNKQDRTQWLEEQYNKTLEQLKDVQTKNENLLNENVELKISLELEKEDLTTVKSVLNRESSLQSKLIEKNKALLEAITEKEKRLSTCIETIRNLNEENKELNESITELENDVLNLNENCVRKGTAIEKLRAEIKRIDESNKGLTPTDGKNNIDTLNENTTRKESAQQRQFITQNGKSTTLTQSKNLPITESVVNRPVSAITINSNVVQRKDTIQESRLASILRNVKNS